MSKNKIKDSLRNFDEFVYEAHVTPTGDLEDFEFTGNSQLDHEIEHESNVEIHKDAVNTFIKNMNEFFKENEATNVTIDVRNELIRMRFVFYGIIYGFIGNLDSGYGELAKLDTDKRDATILGQFSDMNIFFDMIKERGLYFLREIE